MTAAEIAVALEAILFASHRPLRLRELQSATGADKALLSQALSALDESLKDRGVMVQRMGDDVQIVTRPEQSQYVRRALRPDVTGRLSPAAYETLAIVAYQQPVTRGRVEELRGVGCETVLANLELRDLVTEVGRAPGPGQAKLYGTTMRFLQVLGLRSLEDLPVPEALRSVFQAGAAPAELPESSG
ncbi:MAG TPA: SMC-Scp complex subunit ScpB [Candidatus Dormibacteraeota bacterium]